MALFLKYRPQTFNDFVGQESVAKTLKNALKNKKETHAYLFSGSRGTGKTSTARIFAKGLICPHIQDGNPCGKCEFCTKVADGSLVDVIEIDGASNRGIDEIRELREKIAFAPNFADKKIYIIDEVHMLTTPAFNALLKTLEEPPSHAFFLLATTEVHKLPETIISRCQTFIFHKFTREQLIRRLSYIAEKEEFLFEEKALQLIAEKAEGGMRDAISIFEQIAAETENNITESAVLQSLGMAKTEMLEEFLNAIQERNSEKGLSLIQKMSKEGSDLRTFGHNFLNFLRTQMYDIVMKKGDISIILKTIEEFEKALSRLKSSPITELPFEIALINLSYIPQTMETLAKPKLNTSEVVISEVKQSQSSSSIISETKADSELKIKKSIIEEKTESNLDGFIFEEKEITHTRVQQKIKPTTSTTVIEQTSSVSEGICNDQNVLEKIKEIAEHAKLLSSSKMSFLTTKPKINGEKIMFEGTNDFHIQKLQENSENKVKIQNAIAEIFGKKYLVEFCVVKKENTATIDDFAEYFR